MFEKHGLYLIGQVSTLTHDDVLEVANSTEQGFLNAPVWLLSGLGAGLILSQVGGSIVEERNEEVRLGFFSTLAHFANMLQKVNRSVLGHVQRLGKILLLPDVFNRVISKEHLVSLRYQHYGYRRLVHNVLDIRPEDFKSLRDLDSS